MKQLKKLYNGKIHNLYFQLYIIRVIKSSSMGWVGYATCMGEMRNAYKLLVKKPEGKRSLGRFRHRLKGNIKMNLK